MIPNDFGLIRQRNHTLMACLFPLIKDISEYHIELLYAEPDEWNLGSFYSSNTGDRSDNPNMKCTRLNISKFDYVLCPISTTVSQTVYSGLTATNTSGLTLRTSTSSATPTNAYVVYKCDGYNFAAINERISDNLPIIGFIRHRSDEVNPKGIIKDVNSDILQPVKADKLNGETVSGRDELPGSIEKSDLDTIADSGTEPEANG